SIAQGKLYLCAAPLDAQASNFHTGYYFAPLLYKMASQNGNSNIFTQTIGSNKPIRITNKEYNDRQLWHLKGNHYEGIPPQSPYGSGVHINTEKLLLAPGFYIAARQERLNEPIIIAFNAD